MTTEPADETCPSMWSYADSLFRCVKLPGHDGLHGTDEADVITVTWDDTVTASTPPKQPFPGGGAPHPANDPATDPVGTVRRDQQGRLYIRTDMYPSPEWIVYRDSYPYRSLLRMSAQDLAGTSVIGVVPDTPAAEVANPNGVLWADVLSEQVASILADITKNDPFGWPTDPDTAAQHAEKVLTPVVPVLDELTAQRNLANAIAESLTQQLDDALRELEQWRSGSRITQESSDQQDRAIKAEHRLVDANLELEEVRAELTRVVDVLDPPPAGLTARVKHAVNPDPLPINATAQIQRALVRHEASFNGSTVYELLDLFRSWMPQDVPEFWVGQRVLVGECVGTVHHCPPRVRVHLDGAPAVGEFLAKFVHPVTEEG